MSIEEIPDHSAFSRARNDWFRDSDVLRSVFERIVGACIAAGLVGGEGFASVSHNQAGTCWKGLSAGSEEKRVLASDLETVLVESLKTLDPNRPIREADIGRVDRFLS